MKSTGKLFKTMILGSWIALALSGCASSDPLGNNQSISPANDAPESSESTQTIVVGSQDYYSNEIIAEIYAQALENDGYQIDRQFRIGQREAYIPEIESGNIDLIPEYTGNLLQYWDPNTEARLSDEVYAQLVEATPSGLQVLDQSEATDQDSYTVTKDYADKWGLNSVEDLAKVSEPIVLGGNSELETRPYGPQGLKNIYGIDVSFTPIEDSGGPLTIKALNDGKIQLANVFTADPSIAQNDLVSLKDTKGLFLASNVVPLATTNLDDNAKKIVNQVSALMTSEDLIALNTRSIDEQVPSSTVATGWLKDRGLVN